VDNLSAAIEEFKIEIDLLGLPKTDTVAWHRLQALSLARSFLLTAQVKEFTTPEQIDLLRKKIRVLLVKEEDYNPEPAPEPEVAPT
jgi:hypothetical protein